MTTSTQVNKILAAVNDNNSFLGRPSSSRLQNPLVKSNTPFTPAKHVLLNWFSLNENYKQRTEKLDFPLDSSTC